MINIVKASAGSGKTFNLARTYISLLLKSDDRYAYRHILAVTFTNKATDEMKSRILKELYILSAFPERSGYLNDFVPALFDSVDDLRRRSENLLSNILHDYSAFAVSTIDRFFQQTLKAFSREIGQFASYQVELDKDSLVSESVDRILDSLTEKDTGLLGWLTDNVLEQIEQSGKYSLDISLKSMAKRLRSSEHREKIAELGIDEFQAYSKENLSRIRTSCRRIISDYTSMVSGCAGRVISLMTAEGVSPADTSRHFMNRLYDYVDLKPGDSIPVPTASFMANASDHEKWFSKAASRKYLPLVYPLIEAPLNDFCNLFGMEYSVYSTAKIIDGQLYGLGVAGELDRTFSELMKEKNVLCLDDSNAILKGIIDGSDAPFIYEKLGVRFEHFLLDEFQDTSKIQWENFRPLVQNSDSQGFDNLIVGDVKQSIYRWRGSDWGLLDSGLQKELSDVRVDKLQTNYRSLGNIVEFNNAFFPEAAAVLDSAVPGRSGRNISISEIYGDVVQNVASGGSEKGSVHLTFCPKENEADMVLESILRVREKGAGYGDIAVLVRNNSSGGSIASFLIDNGIPVITDDSLKIRSSITVRRLVSLMYYVDNPSDTVGGFLAESLGIKAPETYHSLMDLAESLLRALKIYNEEVFDGETLYIQSFMDTLQDYVSMNGNTLRSFLKHWEELNPSISSPTLGDSVRVMTVHKSKGLDFPYVIFPYAETVNLYKSTSYWCHPKAEGTPFESFPKAVFDVELSSKSENTLFADDYHTESGLQYVDNINTLYVALTRASKGMHIIAKTPSKSCMEAVDKGVLPDFKDMSQMLYWFASADGRLGFVRSQEEGSDISFSLGEIYDFAGSGKSGKSGGGLFAAPEEFVSGYPSWPLNPSEEHLFKGNDEEENDVRVKGRLKFSADAVDFFSDDGMTGVAASHRLRGIVLHNILSGVVVPSDLGKAVAGALRDGYVNESESAEVLELLSERIAPAASRGWFPDDPSAVRNETALFDCDGSVLRPDRVVHTEDGGVVIIDYKFGEHNRRYERQIARYADIYRRMGYGNVSTALWYVDRDEVIHSA